MPVPIRLAPDTTWRKTSDLHLNLGVGPHPAPAPWLNVDVVHAPDHGIVPDVVIPDGLRLPFADGAAVRVYLGHVLEHIAWPDVPAYLAEVRRVLAADGELVVVGPDVYRSIRGWRDGTETWDLVCSVLEDDAAIDAFRDPDDPIGRWDGARHHWNCTEQRIVNALIAAGFADVTPLPIASTLLDSWPVVARAPWQAAVSARR